MEGAAPDIDGLSAHSDVLLPFIVGGPGCNPPMTSIRDILMDLNDEHEIISEDKGDHARLVAANAADLFRTRMKIPLAP